MINCYFSAHEWWKVYDNFYSVISFVQLDTNVTSSSLVPFHINFYVTSPCHGNSAIVDAEVTSPLFGWKLELKIFIETIHTNTTVYWYFIKVMFIYVWMQGVLCGHHLLIVVVFFFYTIFQCWVSNCSPSFIKALMIVLFSIFPGWQNSAVGGQNT